MNASPPVYLDLLRLKQLLGPTAGRFDVDCLAECPSTNSLLLQRAEQGAPSGSVLVCENQTAGRGRRGRTWLAPPAGSLTFSLLWRWPPGAPFPMGLSLAVGVAVARGLESLGLSDARLKWPNDVLLNGRKLAGVLVEGVSSRTGGLGVVIGIGLNLALPPDFPDTAGLQAADLAASLSPCPSRTEVLAAILGQLAQVLNLFQADGFTALRSEWMRRNAYQDVAVYLGKDDGSREEGTCRGVDEDGALLLEIGGRVTRVLVGDVSLRAAP